jgi:hypothetical protein
MRRKYEQRVDLFFQKERRLYGSLLRLKKKETFLAILI